MCGDRERDGNLTFHLPIQEDRLSWKNSHKLLGGSKVVPAFAYSGSADAASVSIVRVTYSSFSSTTTTTNYYIVWRRKKLVPRSCYCTWTEGWLNCFQHPFLLNQSTLSKQKKIEEEKNFPIFLEKKS